ncbi:hypothetical protein HN958_04075 [Candidatus Falkowbacteria bacterium]|jgi:hypothetical protein|nr:hypothetical protein [Candidatus Falkowbacteria bacterium]MBT7007654.1 hypothetical protein [Candidatus Falkowbacteria bacterium]
MRWIAKTLLCILIIVLAVHIAKSAKANDLSLDDRLTFLEFQAPSFQMLNKDIQRGLLFEMFIAVNQTFELAVIEQDENYKGYLTRLTDLVSILQDSLPEELRPNIKRYFPLNKDISIISIVDSVSKLRQEIFQRIYFDPEQKSALYSDDVFVKIYELHLWRNAIMPIALIPHFQSKLAQQTIREFTDSNCLLIEHEGRYKIARQKSSRH